MPGGPSTNPIQEALSGVAQISVGYAPEIMYAANQGLPIKSFAATFQRAPLTFYSLGEANIRSIRDWKGKRIGASQASIPQIKAVLHLKGMKFDDIKFVQAQVPALLQGQVDAVGSWPTNVAVNAPIVSRPGGYNTQSVWDNGLQFQSNYYMAPDRTIRNDSETLVRFLEAADKGWAYAADYPEDAINLVVSVSSALNKDQELASLKIITRDFIYTDATRESGFGTVSKERWNATVKSYADIGEIKRGLSADDVFDDRILKGARRTRR